MQTLLVLAWLSILPAVLLVYPSGTTGHSIATDFLKEKETLVQNIAKFALHNYQNAAALAEKCGTSTTCSRRVCQPLLSDFPLSCENVDEPQTFDCEGSNNSTCILVSKNKGYVRWARDANPEDPTCDMTSTICSQRELDGQIFIEEGKFKSDFQLQAMLHFGASNGIHRIYPGKELSDSACNNYDIRERPWYKGATAVSKEIVVMLDAGHSMEPPLSLATGPAQIFDASRNITLRLLNTLSKGDKISVFTCGPSPSTPTMVGSKITMSDSSSGSGDTALQNLRSAISNLPFPSNSSFDYNLGVNLTSALIAARDQFSNYSTTQLKVVIIITAGDIVGSEDLQSGLLDSLKTSNMTVFTNRLLGTNIGKPLGNDDFSSKLKNASCAFHGWYEEDLYQPQNPLGTLKSFYSFVAKLRFEQNGQRPYWVQKYTAYSGIGEVIAVACPVFSDNFFLGVAAVSVAVNNLGHISSEVVKLLADRNIVRSLDVNEHPQINCSQTLLGGNNSCPMALNGNPTITGFCNDVDANTNKEQMFKDRVCCQNQCTFKGDGLSKLGKIGIIVGGVLGGTLILICLFASWWKISSILKGDDQSEQPLANPQSPVKRLLFL